MFCFSFTKHHEGVSNEKQLYLQANKLKYTIILIYHKIPKISPGAYISQRPFLRGLFLEGLTFGGAYLRREICVSKSIGLAS